MIKTNYMSEDNKKKRSLKKLGIIGVIATQLLLSGCAPKEKPPIDEPKAETVMHFETLLREDDDIVVIDGENKTIKDLKEEYGFLYHFYVDYTDEEIEDLFENYLRIIEQAIQYWDANSEEIMQKKKPSIGKFGNYQIYQDDNLVKLYAEFSILSNENIANALDGKDPRFLFIKKYAHETPGGLNLGLYDIFSITYGSESPNFDEIRSISISKKKENLLIHLLSHEIFLEAARKSNFKIEMAKEFNFED